MKLQMNNCHLSLRIGSVMKVINQSYNLSIYNLNVIKTAIHMYSEICQIKLNVIGSRATCSFFSDQYDVGQIVLEFDNFLIELLQQEGRGI